MHWGAAAAGFLSYLPSQDPLKGGPLLSHLQAPSPPTASFLTSVLNTKPTEDPFPQDHSPWNTIHFSSAQKGGLCPWSPTGFCTVSVWACLLRGSRDHDLHCWMEPLGFSISSPHFLGWRLPCPLAVEEIPTGNTWTTRGLYWGEWLSA